MPSPSPTHENQLRKLPACLASFITTTTKPATLYSINIQFSFLPVIKKSNTEANSDSYVHNFSTIIFTHPSPSPLTHATQIDKPALLL